ncbi:YDG/SRA domain-containing protein [Crossiella sp. CA198]|uniref:YDG/SRA domain-containing protein n=1 Tax=Crossiella sp. CA198 TaxID=3455607 RepID=UPI003F8D8CFE
MAGVDVVGLLDNLRVNTATGQLARHQPLLLLWAAGRAVQGLPRTTAWQSVRPELTALLAEFGHPGAQASPEYPFVALSRTKLWELDGYSEPVPPAHGSGVVSWLARNNPHGGLTDPVYRTLAHEHKVRNKFAQKIIEKYFAGEDTEALLNAVGLGDINFDRFGEVPWVPEDTHFPDRAAAFDALVHRQRQAGICGTEKDGAESIVVSGGYEDDVDLGDIIIYTGEGGNENGKQVADQKMTKGNAALRTSYRQQDALVRVLRGYKGDPKYSPSSGYRYDGLFRVASYWSEKGKSGYLVWRYKVVRAGFSTAEANLAEFVAKAEKGAPPGVATPERAKVIRNSVKRLRAVAAWVKNKHNSRCQVCALQLEVPKSFHAETAHIKPLGMPSNGPDSAENCLCLCPNDHARFDRGAIVIEDDLTIINAITGEKMGELRTVAGHNIEVSYLAWHRNFIRNRAIS